jgi:UDP-glucose 4-epimerase
VKTLITGGAGYIGSHIAHSLYAEGLDVVIVDDLSSGHRSFVPYGVPFIDLSVLQTAALKHTMLVHGVSSVVHLAGFKYAGRSIEQPLHTYDQNVNGTMSVLKAMAQSGVHNLVFSSSAAVYGTPDHTPVTEESPVKPESPYGESKLISEWMIANQPNLRHTSLRYFNVAGSGSDQLYDSSPCNLFPCVINAIRTNEQPVIFGGDYPTPDGTCVRDYVHVSDVADAHVTAIKRLYQGETLEPVYNLGSGRGASVLEVVKAFGTATGKYVEPRVEPRRQGDPASIVASGERAARDLGWTAQRTLNEMAESAWDAAN